MEVETKQDPSISLILLAYKQERFIAEAVHSVLAQTGPPIEIVISDDCSPDQTFRVIQAIAKGYTGSHKIILNKNPTNLGLAGNLNRAWELSRGEFVIIQAGDDLSVPDRTQKLVARWLETEKRADLVCSYFEEIDENSRSTGYIKKEVMFLPDMAKDVGEWRCGATGACAAYSRKLYDKYGPLNTNVISEDWVFSFRAWLEGEIQLIKEPLVKHRTHDESISVAAKNLSKIADRKSRRLRRRKMQAGALGIAEEWLKAWRIAKGDSQAEIEDALNHLVNLRRAQLDAFEASPLNVLKITGKVLHLGGPAMALKLGVRHLLKVY